MAARDTNNGTVPSTPLSNTRARAVREAGDISDLAGGTPGGAGGSAGDGGGVGLADAAAALEGFAASLGTAAAASTEHVLQLADDMSAVQEFRRVSVETLGKVAADLAVSVAAARKEAEEAAVVSREEVAELQRALEEANEAEEERMRDAESSLPVLKNQLNLMLVATGVKFYPKGDGVTKGFFKGFDEAGVETSTPFAFDLKTMSRVEAVNNLWDLMG